MAPTSGIFAALLVLLVCGSGVNEAMSSDGWPSLAGRLRLVGDYSELEGVIETFIYDEWRMVCGQNWTLDHAHLVCRKLGHSSGAADAHAVPIPEALLSEPVLVDLVSCVGGQEGEFMECDDYVSSGDDWCNPFEVAWVRCAPDHIELFPAAEALNMEREIETGVKPVASDIGDGSVTLDWADWYREEIDGDSLFFVRFVIMYRVANNDASMEYEIAAEPRTTERRYTVSGLKARTWYEFIVEGVRLGDNGEEIHGPATNPLVVKMPCGAPSQVSNPTVWPQNGTGSVLKLSWDRPSEPDCPPSSFIVQFQLKNLEQCGQEVQVPDSASMAGSTTQTEFTLGGLHPYSTYTVYVTARNQHGASQTWQSTVMTNGEAPSAAPTGIISEYIKETTLHISWESIPCGHQSGIITGYSYILLDLTTDEVTHTGHTIKTTVDLKTSQVIRHYKFLVAARTVAGRGPYAAGSVDAQPKLFDICGRTAQVSPSRDLVSKDGIQKIVSGKVARKGSAPWLAQVWNVETGNLFCHGSIIDNRWILTAAHCIRRHNSTKDDIMIQLGDFDKNLPEEEEQAYRVEEIKVHSNFDTDLFDADVALIKLARPIGFTDYVRPICMPPKSLAKSMLTVGKRGVVSGWGRISNSDANPRYPKTVTLPVKEQATCRRSTPYQVTSNMFCAGYSQAGKGDSCEGDSGAPFTVQHTNNRWYILGVVSWGEGCDKMDKFGFYVRLHRYTAWIRKHTGIKLS